MTLQEHEELAERLKVANVMRGKISAYTKKVQEWTRIEDACKLPDKKEWAKKKTIEAINKLNEWKKKYKEL